MWIRPVRGSQAKRCMRPKIEHSQRRVRPHAKIGPGLLGSSEGFGRESQLGKENRLSWHRQVIRFLRCNGLGRPRTPGQPLRWRPGSHRSLLSPPETIMTIHYKSRVYEAFDLFIGSAQQLKAKTKVRAPRSKSEIRYICSQNLLIVNFNNGSCSGRFGKRRWRDQKFMAALVGTFLWRGRRKDRGRRPFAASPSANHDHDSISSASPSRGRALPLSPLHQHQ